MKGFGVEVFILSVLAVSVCLLVKKLLVPILEKNWTEYNKRKELQKKLKQYEHRRQEMQFHLGWARSSADHCKADYLQTSIQNLTLKIINLKNQLYDK